MTQTPTKPRQTDRRHRAKGGTGVYVTDQELIEYLGIPADIARRAIHALDRDPRSGFPRKQPFWGDRRYLPAIEKWLDAHNRLTMGDPQRRAS
jgi:hypothetical protein